jgi:hypothetical protein
MSNGDDNLYDEEMVPIVFDRPAKPPKPQPPKPPAPPPPPPMVEEALALIERLPPSPTPEEREMRHTWELLLHDLRVTTKSPLGPVPQRCHRGLRPVPIPEVERRKAFSRCQCCRGGTIVAGTSTSILRPDISWPNVIVEIHTQRPAEWAGRCPQAGCDFLEAGLGPPAALLTGLVPMHPRPR